VKTLFDSVDQPSLAVGSGGTLSWLAEHCAAASHLHLACHGTASLNEPVGGALQLGADTELRMDDLIRWHLASCRLAVASACQSGHYAASDTPDEVLGLPTGFLQAGAACAIVSLWPVDDYATALLLARFYELLEPVTPTERQQPTMALRAARTWLRRLTGREVDNFVNSRPHLASVLENRGVRDSSRPSRDGDNLIYDSPADWAAFVAYGC
jgi:CHAT domain-containing protein